ISCRAPATWWRSSIRSACAKLRRISGDDMADDKTIRPANPDDVPAIERVVDAAYLRYVERIGKKPGPMLDDYPARVAEGAVSVLISTGEIVGVIVLLPEADHLLLDNIAVLPAR